MWHGIHLKYSEIPNFGPHHSEPNETWTVKSQSCPNWTRTARVIFLSVVVPRAVEQNVKPAPLASVLILFYLVQSSSNYPRLSEAAKISFIKMYSFTVLVLAKIVNP